MELKDSGKTISFFLRIFFQVPTIAFSTLSIIALSRNLGPSGRGEVSQLLLLAALTSSVLCTPIFLTIMNLENSRAIKEYISRSLYLFNWKNVTLILLLNICVVFLNKFNEPVFNLQMIVSLNLLILFYFIAAQIRDLLLRFHKNEIYGIDFLVQLVITGSVLAFIHLETLTVSIVIYIFVLTYGLFAILLLLLLKLKVQDFEFSNLIKKKINNSLESNLPESDGKFSRLGVLFQLSLSKDMLFGLFLLTKAEFGLMAALGSFWVVIRFLRPSALIQVKVRQGSTLASNEMTRGAFNFVTRASSAIYVQAFSIGVMGIFGYIFTPILMGGGFEPGVNMTIAGLTSEILLMKCLHDMSTCASKYLQNIFLFLCLFQITMLGVLGALGINLSITFIWFSSGVIYLVWLTMHSLWCRK